MRIRICLLNFDDFFHSDQDAFGNFECAYHLELVPPCVDPASFGSVTLHLGAMTRMKLLKNTQKMTQSQTVTLPCGEHETVLFESDLRNVSASISRMP